jgi:hypothetical protein
MRMLPYLFVCVTCCVKAPCFGQCRSSSWRTLRNRTAKDMISVMLVLLCLTVVCQVNARNCRSQWPRGLRRSSATARLLRLWVQIPGGAWMFVYCDCCVLSGRGLCDELIAGPEESCRLWCVVVCDLETL